MMCPVCEKRCVVVEKRQTEWCMRRRYKCPKCGNRYNTREAIYVEDTLAWQDVRHEALLCLDEIRRIAGLRRR